MRNVVVRAGIEPEATLERRRTAPAVNTDRGDSDES